jgi:hypothetical protein
MTECISVFHNNSASSKYYLTLGVLNIILTLYVRVAIGAASKTQHKL